MPTYEQLYHLNLSNLKAAADRWRQTATKFKGLHTAYSDEVAAPFKQAGWHQPVLTAAKADSDVRAAHQEFEDAQKEAEGIAGVLASLHGALKKAKDDLNHLAEVEAPKQELHVSASGVVTPRNDLSQDTGARHDPDGQALIREQQQACDAFARRIEAVLQQAADADETACWALRRDLGGYTDNFNSKVVMSLDSADATHAAELMKKGDKLTDTELTELNHLLKSNQGDAEFSTNFYKQLGQKGTLQLYGQLALQTADAGDERKALLQELQRNMGNNLATATNPGKTPHLDEQWTADLRKLGTQHIALYPDSMREGPYGYQLLGGILRYGDYDSSFLTPIAEHVTQLHAKDPYFFAGTKSDFGGSDYGFNPSGKNGAGYDPMNSVLEALGHSPQAATDYFTPPMEKYTEDGTHKGELANIDGANSYLDYLVNKDYESFPDITGHDPDAAQKSMNDFPDSLGHALEAATTGRPAGADPSTGPLAHSPDQAALASQVINKFSGPDAGGLLNSDDGTAPYTAATDSLGNIGADYMGDIQRSISGQNSLPVQGTSAELVDAEVTKEFLYQVSQDPDAYAALTGSQQAYTSALIDAEINGPNDSQVDLTQRVSSAAHPGAEVAGIMSAARAHAVHDTHAHEDTEYNESVDTANKWVGRGLGLAIGKIPVAGEAVGWVVEDVQESVANSLYQDTTNEAQSEAGRTYTTGESALREAVRADIARSGASSSLSSQTISDLQNAVGRETDQSHTTGAEWGDQYHG
ncbi:hypothetical protein AQJ46_06310 [Streptomyces canus]|uniref:AG2 protein n=1 Tax=Streptomyces canus TaxID=58343 RepID=A0A124I0C1_9ACTN|nr:MULTISPECIES: DUF6571 family protein [Streptomyces]KUN73890.1 hypothetical protein AQJ46_06310 [Streptomyces canus]MDI5912304.1 hypothetical protein [Streptomyces sp. 12257]